MGLESRGDGSYALSGELGFANAEALYREGRSAFGGLQAVELDLSGVTRADSAGLAVLVEWAVAARAAGRNLHYRGVPGALSRMARIGGVDALLKDVQD